MTALLRPWRLWRADMEIERDGKPITVEIVGTINGGEDEEEFHLNVNHEGSPIELTCLEAFQAEEILYQKLIHAH